MIKILIVEDDRNLNKGICFAMKKEGYEVRSVTSLKEAREHLKTEQTDLILLDLNLPDGDGMDFCTEVRESSEVPIIMLTARDLETDEVLGLESGADDYLTKPFSLAVLKARVAKTIHVHKLTDSDVEVQKKGCSYEELSLNSSELKIYKSGIPLNLTVTEFKLLAYFMENQGLTLTKNQILEAIWDKDENFVDENTLAVNIKRLRKKIDSGKRESFIQTVFGIGYQFGGRHA